MLRAVYLLVVLVSCQFALYAQTTPVDYVNPIIGTQSKFELSNGNTYPAIARPWGMNFWTPQTGRMGDGWQYTYNADKINGFKQTHQPSPWNNDYGQFAVLPVVGTPQFDQDKRASWFSHKAEIVKPYYYSVYLADYDVTTEFSPTERASFFKITYPKTDSAYFIIDAFDKNSYVKVIPEQRKIIGYSTRNSGGVPANFKNYFVIQFDHDFETMETISDGKGLSASKEVQSNHSGVIVGFKKFNKKTVVQALVASSFISFDQAELNLNEIKGKNFAQVVDEGKKAWNDVLGRVQVQDNNIDHLRTFYSCLYRSLLFPRDFSELDAHGKRWHYSPYNGKVLPGEMFTDTGFWDTFRSLFPLLNFIYPEMNDRMQAGLVNAYLESGFLPEWASPGHRESMIGNNSTSIVADAAMTGRTGYDKETLWQAVVHGANAVDPKISSTGRFAFDLYNRYGYVPADKGVNQNVARTLEYAYDDWCIYQYGKSLGKSEEELRVFREHALNYKNIFNPENNLMQGKNSNGKFVDHFDPSDWSVYYTEGNAWHWSFCVFHDIQGLINKMGNDQKFVHMLDTVFKIPSYEGMKSRGVIHEMREMQVMDMGQYAHGNQPIQHMPYLYSFAKQPWKGQYWIRKIMDKLYLPTPDGYCGDEDNGQTSAWYVFSSLGFYPVTPGANQYVIGSPQFKEVTIQLANGKKLRLTTTNNGEENYYINAIRMNNKAYSKNYFNYEDLMKGGQITFDMSGKPNTKRGIAETDKPYSLSTEKSK